MTTIALSTLRARLRIYLSDTNSKTWSEDSDLDLFLNHAIIKFTHDLPNSSYNLFTVADDQVGDANTYELPTDFVRDAFVRGYFEGVSNPENILRLNIQPGVWETGDEPRGYVIDWPMEGLFYLPRSPMESTFTMYYGAYHEDWLTEDVDTFDMGRNRWGEQAIYAYASFLAFNPSSSRRAQLEQWNRRGDQNVGNPLEEEAYRWLKIYNDLLIEHGEVPSTWEFVPMGIG
jgi:hypothetical protein